MGRVIPACPNIRHGSLGSLASPERLRILLDAARALCIFAASLRAPEGYATQALKIGRTKGDPAKRIASAAEDPTFLRQPARLVRQWDLVGYEPKDVEAAVHAFFSEVALVQEMVDGFGKTISIREWFLVDPEIVDEAVSLILQRRIREHRYDAFGGKIVSA